MRRWITVLAVVALAAGLGAPPATATTEVSEALAAGGWPMVQGNLRHTGRTTVIGPTEPGRRCSTAVGADSGSPVVAPDGTVYVPSGNANQAASAWKLYAFRPNCSG